MRILGIVILIFGLADLAGIYLGYSLWSDIADVVLPDFLATYGPLVEIALGAGLLILNNETKAYS